MATHERPPVRADTRGGAMHGVIGGIIAGIIFALFEMAMAALMMGASAFWMPLRMIGAIALGAEALEPNYSLVTAAVAGGIVHMVMSMIFGGIFGALVGAVPSLRQSSMTPIVAASVFGLALWLVNFYLIAPALGWNWFPERTNPVVQLFAHTFFFGTALGLYLSGALLNRYAAAAR